jgi:hypothetical protein
MGQRLHRSGHVKKGIEPGELGFTTLPGGPVMANVRVSTPVISLSFHRLGTRSNKCLLLMAV